MLLRCWYAVREGKTSHQQGDRTQATVWEFPNNNPFGSPRREQSWGHGTQKPVECMRRPIAGNVTAQIFWLKTRAHWREKTASQDPVTRGDSEPNSQVVLVPPDNSGDPELTQALQDAQQKYFAGKSQR